MAELAGFQQRGARVLLLAPEQAEISRRARRAGIVVRPLSGGKLGFLANTVKTARWLRAERFEIVNPHSSRDGWLVGLAARLAGSPLVIRTRHIDVEYHNRWLSRHAFVTLADHLLTTSEKITRHFQTIFGLPPSRISTIPTGIDLTRFSPLGSKADLPRDFSPMASSATAAPGAPGVPGVPGVPEVPVVGMVSVLRSWKGHSVFLAAVRLLKQTAFKARFLIVGDGPMRSSIVQSILDSGLEHDVLLAGHREDVPETLRALDLLIIPSTRHEGVPQIGLQALATMTPVIGSDTGGIPEIIQSGKTGRIFPSGNPQLLADAIRESFMRPDETRGMTERGRQLVERHHSLDSMLDAIEAIYSRYLGSKPGSLEKSPSRSGFPR